MKPILIEEALVKPSTKVRTLFVFQEVVEKYGDKIFSVSHTYDINNKLSILVIIKEETKWFSYQVF